MNKLRKIISIFIVCAVIALSIAAISFVAECSCEEKLKNCYCSDHYVTEGYR